MEYQKYLKYKSKYLQLKYKIENEAISFQTIEDNNTIIPAHSSLQQMRLDTFENEQEGGFTLTTGYYAFFCNSKNFMDYKKDSVAPKISDIKKRLDFKAYSYKLYTARALDLKIGKIGKKQGEKFNLVISDTPSDVFKRYLQEIEMSEDNSELWIKGKESFLSDNLIKPLRVGIGKYLVAIFTGIQFISFYFPLGILYKTADLFRLYFDNKADTQKDIEFMVDKYFIYEKLPLEEKQKLELRYADNFRQNSGGLESNLQNYINVKKNMLEKEEDKKKLEGLSDEEKQKLFDSSKIRYILSKIKSNKKDAENLLYQQQIYIPIIQPLTTQKPTINDKKDVLSGSVDTFIEVELKNLNKKKFFSPFQEGLNIEEDVKAIVINKLKTEFDQERKKIQSKYVKLTNGIDKNDSKKFNEELKKKLTTPENKKIVNDYNEMIEKLFNETRASITTDDFKQRMAMNEVDILSKEKVDNMNKYNEENKIDCCVIININVIESNNKFLKRYKLEGTTIKVD
jgi:hypothetical protein